MIETVLARIIIGILSVKITDYSLVLKVKSLQNLYI
jgi:hypothetical protein